MSDIYWDIEITNPTIQVEKLDETEYKLRVTNNDTPDVYETIIRTYDFESEIIELNNLEKTKNNFWKA